MEVNTVKAATFGAIVGDALGVPVEFMSRSELEACPVTDMRANGTHNQPAGTWSDDSSMLLCLMESLTRGIDYEDMADTFLRWADEGYWTAHGEVFDMGIATRKALVKFAHRTPALECGNYGQHDNGNGSLMRMIPLALYLHEIMGPCWNDEFDAYEIVNNASKITHGHPLSLISCGIYCSIANEIMRGNQVDNAVYSGIEKAKAVYGAKQEYAEYLPQFDEVALKSLKELPITSIRGSGYVLETLKAALWCLLHTDSYQACVLQAVNLGEDTDTVATVAGGLAGLWYGWNEIPVEWIAALSRKDEIDQLCTDFCNKLNGMLTPADYDRWETPPGCVYSINH